MGSDDRSKEPRFHVSDKRFWVLDENAEERVEVLEKRYPTYVEELKARTETAERRLKDRLKELEEENAAFRNRIDRQLEIRLEAEVGAILESFLEIADNFQRALDAAERSTDLDSLRRGITLNLELFFKKLEALGVEPIAVEGQPFDPEVAEAVSVVAVEDPARDDTVVEVTRPGYRFKKKVIRSPMVVVGQYDAERS